jgi:hypothetical protein
MQFVRTARTYNCATTSARIAARAVRSRTARNADDVALDTRQR